MNARAFVRTWSFTVAALVLASTGNAASISTPFYYETFGDVGTSAGVAIGSFDFTGASGQLLTPGSFSLGQFQARPLAEGAGLTYHNLPFYIELEGGTSTFPQKDLARITGVLNGTVTGAYQSDVTATITSIQPGLDVSSLPFPLSALAVNVPQVLAASAVNGGRTTLTATVNATPAPPAIPEPTSAALFGLAFAAAAAHSFRRRFRVIA